MPQRIDPRYLPLMKQLQSASFRVERNVRFDNKIWPLAVSYPGKRRKVYIRGRKENTNRMVFFATNEQITMETYFPSLLSGDAEMRIRGWLIQKANWGKLPERVAEVLGDVSRRKLRVVRRENAIVS